MKKIQFILEHSPTGEEIELECPWLCGETNSLCFKKRGAIGMLPTYPREDLSEYKVWIVIDYIKYEMESC